MGLDIFTRAQAEGLDFAQQHIAQDLPLEFGEAFDAAWREGLLFGQSVSSSTARMQGVQDYLDGIREKTGTMLTNPALGGGDAALAELNGQLTALAPRFPGLNLKPLTVEDLDRLGEEKARRGAADLPARCRPRADLGRCCRARDGLPRVGSSRSGEHRDDASCGTGFPRHRRHRARHRRDHREHPNRH